MKKLYVWLFFVYLLIPITARAETEQYEEMYDINLQDVELVTATEEIAVYSTNTYTNGFFDIHANLIDSNNLPAALYDNDIGTSYGIGTNKYTVRFKKNLRIVGVYTRIHTSYASNGLRMNFYDVNDTLVNTLLVRDGKDLYTAIIADNVRYVTFNVNSSNRITPQELEIFVDPASLYASVGAIKESNVRDTTATIRWENPTDTFFTGNKVYLDDELISTSSSQSINLNNLAANTEYKITVSAMYNEIEVKKDYFFKTTKDQTPPKNATDLQLKQVNDFVKINWKNPDDNDFERVAIYRNNSKIADNLKTTEYIDQDAPLGKTSSYKIISYDTSGNGSIGITKSIYVEDRTVKDLKATAKDFRAVEIVWNNPKRDDFEKVTIYRKNEQGFLTRIISFFVADDGYTPLFETNGTTFKDLTVTADTQYTYKVTTTINNVEQPDGKEVTIKTPKLAVVGGEGEKTENGDYLFKWQAPTTGRVRVDVAGTTYKTVAAADQQITIPKNIMKYDAFGNPLIKLTPVDENGNPTGNTTTGNQSIGDGSGGNTSTVSMPDELTAKNLLLMGVGLLGVVGGFLLLGLAFKLAPKLINTIRQAFEKRKGVANGR